MSKAKDKSGSRIQNNMASIDDLGDDLMQNILSRSPALSFASAACVSRSWSSVCHRVLSVPKLRSAVSFNPTLENAVNEVMDKVLHEPIRPHFVMVSIGPYVCLQAAFQLIAKDVNFWQIEGKFGSGIPIIVNVCEGVIGKDVLTDQFVEFQWEITEEEDGSAELLESKGGISLTIGFLPGLKVHIIPLLFKIKGPQGILIDDFVMDIREATSTVSSPASPAGIILFSDRETDINPVLQTLEYAFSKDTFIVGDGGCQFLYRSDSGNTITNRPNSGCAAVALVFARDADKPLDIGETKFHVRLSTGVSPIGPTYRAASVKCRKSSTWLTASRETVRGHLDGQAILEEIYDELGNRIQYPAFYIGVTKRRKCSVGMESVRRMQFLEFHEVRGGDEEYLIVNSVGIKTGDSFRFYISDSGAALSSCTKVSNNLGHLKLDRDCGNNHMSDVDHCDKSNVFGGIIFTCCGRGDSFFGLPGIDSSPFLKNFPGVAFGGTYCAGEICRGDLNLYEQDNEEGDLVHCGQHVYSAAYLVMSYSPPPPQH
ncbi:F-box/LRR-repeat protein-like protein [Salvia divinorum]|uniref:F-box/LRR-repeat protein-like protein n=1 Tax=Salvia divinorum TaxID=28513 RepID=A0ABD1GCF6_SALDI